MGSLDRAPGTEDPTLGAMDTDQALQSSFTTEPGGYGIPWNSQGHSAGATQPPSSKISPRVTAKAHLTHMSDL
jgi:hypothetical protein